jgi:adenylylsulfate kinase-like enzyme
MVIWFTGKSGAGKTTLARGLQEELGNDTMLLDADEVRRKYWPELTYTRDDRMKNASRLGYLAREIEEVGITVIVAAITPYASSRYEARLGCYEFVQIFVDCPDNVLKERDTKGLYKSGIDQGEYERPIDSEVYVNTWFMSLQECSFKIATGIRQSRERSLGTRL